MQRTANAFKLGVWIMISGTGTVHTRARTDTNNSARDNVVLN